ncbi:MAG: hypothetical protein R2695_06525 [Acidimicrobiales bacterium]
MWPITGISAPMIFSIIGSCLRPPRASPSGRHVRAAAFCTVSWGDTW